MEITCLPLAHPSLAWACLHSVPPSSQPPSLKQGFQCSHLAAHLQHRPLQTQLQHKACTATIVGKQSCLHCQPCPHIPSSRCRRAASNSSQEAIQLQSTLQNRCQNQSRVKAFSGHTSSSQQHKPHTFTVPRTPRTTEFPLRQFHTFPFPPALNTQSDPVIPDSKWSHPAQCQ